MTQRRMWTLVRKVLIIEKKRSFWAHTKKRDVTDFVVHFNESWQWWWWWWRSRIRMINYECDETKYVKDSLHLNVIFFFFKRIIILQYINFIGLVCSLCLVQKCISSGQWSTQVGSWADQFPVERQWISAGPFRRAPSGQANVIDSPIR